METTEKYEPFGKEWEKEVLKLPKKELIKMIITCQLGTDDEKLRKIRTSFDAKVQVESIINDFEHGINSKEKTIELLGEYTYRLMKLFQDNCLLQNEQFKKQSRTQ